MSPLMSYLTAFGLASGVGVKAFIPVLALGAFHHTGYFVLSDRWAWIASPAVMVVLAVLVLAEILVDSIPELGELSDTVAYLPKMVVGFIAFAAATGTVDQSLLELTGSGLLGTGTAAAAHWMRNGVRRPIRDYVEDVHEGVSRTASEAGVSAVVTGGAIVSPVVGLVLLAVLAGAALMVARALDRRRVPCVHCAEPIRPGAVICVHCGREQSAGAQTLAGPGTADDPRG